MPPSHLDRWRTRFQKSADLLAARLSDPPSLEELAAAAAVSPFHFHRIWRALTGETVAKSMLRLRIDASRVLLAESESSVTDTALAVGFGTPQSFARAFRRLTHESPSDFRDHHGALSGSLPPPAVEVVRRGEVLVVALRCEGRAYLNLNAVFGEVWAWADRSGALPRLSGIYGLPHDDPVSVAENLLRYDACLALGVDTVPHPFQVRKIPAGEFARAQHWGSYEAIEASTQALVEAWIANSARGLSDHPIVYQFMDDPEVTPTEKLRTEILLPLEGVDA